MDETRNRIQVNSNCETCGHYQLKLMVTSGKPYGYSGDIPCFRCSRYSQLSDCHTNKSGLPQD